MIMSEGSAERQPDFETYHAGEGTVRTVRTAGTAKSSDKVIISYNRAKFVLSHKLRSLYSILLITVRDMRRRYGNIFLNIFGFAHLLVTV